MSNPKSPKPLNTPNPNMANNSVGLKKTTPANAAAKNSAAAAPTADTSATATAQDDVVRAVEKLETRSKALNSNNVARVANSWLNSHDDKLHTMYSLKTGKPLDKFPPTSRDIAKLNLPAVDLMLNHLDADRTGSEEAKKERLRLQFGLRPTPA
ncbi:hypothetical protein MBLNU230_g0434t1 [Neophaeotheca triangularis]